MRKDLDQAKSRKAIKSLVLKKQLSEAHKSLHECEITWGSDLQRIFSSSEQFKTSQLQKKYYFEKQLHNILTLLSPGSFLTTCEDTQICTDTIKAIKAKQVEGTLTIESFYSTASQVSSSANAIRDKIWYFLNPSLKPQSMDTLSSVEENIEFSCETNRMVTEEVSKPLDYPEASKTVSLVQPEEEQVEEVNGFLDLNFTTQVQTKKSCINPYIVHDDEARNDTLDYSKFEIAVKKRNWKYYLCPCMFKKIQY